MSVDVKTEEETAARPGVHHLPLLTLRQAVADVVFPEGRDRRERAEREANTDALTGVANRRAFDRALPAAEADPAVAVVLFDANNFGRVNKAEGGQPAGDALLQEVARSLVSAAAVYGYAGRVFRVGGDEFAVMCGAEEAEQLRDRAERYFGEWPGEGFTVSLTGNVGDSYREASVGLQARKAERKAAGGR
jgi:diguanylate cyclase (GGDEF)-like protein